MLNFHNLGEVRLKGNFGVRELTDEQYNKYSKDLGMYGNEKYRHLIEVAAITFFVPIIPLYTRIFIFKMQVKDENGNRTVVLDQVDLYEQKNINFSLRPGVKRLNKFVVCATEPIDWDIVKSSHEFYLSPILLPILLLWGIYDILKSLITTQKTSH